MTQVRKTPYTSVSVTPKAAAALRRLAAFVSGEVAERVSLSDAILVAEKLAFMHDRSIVAAAQEAGIEPPIDVSDF